MTSLLLAATLLFFQEPGDVVVNERFKVTFVRLDVLAKDRSNALVLDLKPSDFDVRENGKKVDVSFFEVLDLRQVQEHMVLPEETVSGIPINRESQQIIIAIDLESAQLIETRKTFEQLYRFLDDLDLNTNSSINLYSMDRGSVTKGFSRDIGEIKATLKSLEDRHFDAIRRARDPQSSELLLSDHDPGYQPRTSGRGMSNLSDNESNSFFDLERALRSCKDLFGNFDSAGRSRCISDTLETFMEEQRIRTSRVLGELELLAYKFQEEPGLKTIMLVSPGFALHSVSSAYELAETFMDNNGTRGASSFVGTYGKLYLEDEFQRVVHACIKNRIIFHTFDIYNGNLENHRSIGAEFQGSTRNISSIYRNYEGDITMGLRDLADQSGGSFNQIATLGPAMQRTIDSNNFFYVIGYESPEGKPGKFRKIKIKSKRKGVDFQYRKGYFGN